MGLTRMTVETQPDQYVAETSGDRCPAVAGDDADLAQWVRPVLLQTMLAKQNMYEVYDAAQDGWSPSAFHAAVDRRGPGVVLATAVDGQRFGGYNSKGWVGYAARVGTVRRRRGAVAATPRGAAPRSSRRVRGPRV